MLVKLTIFLSQFFIISAQNGSLFEYTMQRMQNYQANSEGPDDGGISQVFTLTQHVVKTHLSKCNLLVIMHPSFEFESKTVNFDVTSLFRNFSHPFAYTKITKNRKVPRDLLDLPGSRCRGYVIFIKDIALTVPTIGDHPESKVVVVTGSSSWKIAEYLEKPEAKGIVNLLVIATTGTADIVVRRGEKSRSQRFINLYTHDLYTDGFGNSRVRLLTSWGGNKLSRNINLFPRKLANGFHGRQFKVAAAQQPPFVIKKNLTLSDEMDTTLLWDGVEPRLLRLFSQFLNYSIKIQEANPVSLTQGPAEVVAEAVIQNEAEISVAGIYRSLLLPDGIAFSYPHSVDCATFVTRSSTALPRYRAILGPFHWHVWLALTLTYFLAIIPLTFAEHHTLTYLWQHPWHIETMFWYVFGTFTNCFSFKGENSWTKSRKNASRMFIGWYWVFSIIVTACYTGSIIAFITLFVYPPVINTLDQLLEENYRIGALSTGGWGQWFNNSDHPKTKWLLRDIELVPNITQGLKNITKSFYLPFLRPYAFLASRAHLDYVIKTNYTLMENKVILHPSRDCFVPFGVTFIYPSYAPFRLKFDDYILRAQQGGLITKLYNDMEWELQRSSTGKLLQAGGGASLREAIALDRRLTLDDTQGMFLLLGAGFLIAITTFIFEKTHHQAIGGFLTFSHLNHMIQHSYQQILKHFSTTVVNEQQDDDFTYKKYDSRVLHSRFNNVNCNFVSEPQLMIGNRQRWRTHSLPDFHDSVPAHTLSKSCHDFQGREAVRCKSKATSVERTMVFGSVGSVLMVERCREVLMHTYLHDRPQTSIF